MLVALRTQETIQVRRAGYPFRLSMETFVRRYAMLLPDGDDDARDEQGVDRAHRHPAHATQRIMSSVMPPDVVDARELWQLGLTRVFIRSDAVLAHLEVRQGEGVSKGYGWGGGEGLRSVGLGVWLGPSRGRRRHVQSAPRRAPRCASSSGQVKIRRMQCGIHPVRVNP
jgi:hypothetical protein